MFLQRALRLASVFPLIFSLGLAQGAQWSEISGPTGPSLAVSDLVTPSVAYLAASQGVYKTQDGGATWSAASQGITNSYIASLAVDPRNPAAVYAGGFGIYRSSNGGGNWTLLKDLSIVQAIAVDPGNSSVIYAGLSAGYGMQKTSDGGATWDAINQGLPAAAVKAIVIDRSNAATVYVGTERDGVYKSTDGGANWAATGLCALDVNALLIDPQNRLTLYAAGSPSLRPACSQTGVNGVFKSVDGGATWAAIHNGLPLMASGGVNADLRAGLTLDPSAPSTLYFATYGGPGAYRSTDGGQSWAAFNDGISQQYNGQTMVYPYFTSLAVGAGGSPVYAPASDRLYVYGTAPATEDACLATLSSDLRLHLPAILYDTGAGHSHLWADLQYTDRGDGSIWFVLNNYGTLAAAPACTPSTLSSALALALPRIRYGASTLDADLQYIPTASGLYFKLLRYGTQ